MATLYEYDVAVSYAGPDRAYAERLAQSREYANLAVGFDLFEEATILGKRLYTFLQDVYENKARYCVVLISQHYATRVWPKHEIQAAFNRAVREKEEYILPVRLDDAKIDGLPSDLAYIAAKGRSVEDIGRILIQKIVPAPRWEADTVRVYVDRRSALDHFMRDIEDERYSITIMTSALDSTMLERLEHAARMNPHLRMRFMFPDPETMESRALQELRAPGQLKLEIQHGISTIQRNLPNAELRLVAVVPVYSAFCVSHAVLYLPYLHTRGAFAAPAFIYRRTGNSPRLFEMIADDLERLWSLARLVDMP
jgi:hypothetical protein